jgi:hypothetical protein
VKGGGSFLGPPPVAVRREVIKAREYTGGRRSGRGETEDRLRFGDERGVIVFGGGSGCSGRGCLFWILISIALSVILTVLANLVLAF